MTRRHVVVTGGGRGIGAAIARRFAEAGDRVTVMARTQKQIDQVADEIGGRSVRVDVGDPASVEAAFMAAGPADVLVNAAGLLKMGELTSTNVRTWEEVLKVNLTGAYLCTLKVLPYMIRKGWGRIINISSAAGLKGVKYLVAYSAAKHGLVGFTRALAEEVAEHGITVNAVCPGYVDTAMTRQSAAALAARLDRDPQELLEAFAAQSPQNRLFTPEEVAEAVFFLASEAAQGINGQAIPLTGGALNC